jgi:hypothetical protein
MTSLVRRRERIREQQAIISKARSVIRQERAAIRRARRSREWCEANGMVRVTYPRQLPEMLQVYRHISDRMPIGVPVAELDADPKALEMLLSKGYVTRIKHPLPHKLLGWVYVTRSEPKVERYGYVLPHPNRPPPGASPGRDAAGALVGTRCRVGEVGCGSAG